MISQYTGRSLSYVIKTELNGVSVGLIITPPINYDLVSSKSFKSVDELKLFQLTTPCLESPAVKAIYFFIFVYFGRNNIR